LLRKSQKTHKLKAQIKGL